MSWEYGLFLGLLPVAGLPIVFHLWLRRRRKKLLFSTLMFFHRVDPRLSSRRKLRELLLLACRVLLIALVLLTLARLTLHASGGLLGLHGQQAVVVLLDNSASMSGPTPTAGQARLQMAIEGTRGLLNNLEEGAEAAVVLLVPDPQAGLESAGMTTDTAALAKALDRVASTEGTGNTARAIARAQALLRSVSPSGGGAIHVFTDLQESEWAQQKIDDSNIPEGLRVFVHKVPAKAVEGPNVAIAQAELLGKRILPRQPYTLQVVLRNEAGGSVKVRLNSEDDQRKTTTEVVELGGGREKTVPVLVQPESPGYHWVKVWIEGDSFTGDNRAAVGYLCENKATVLLVGEAADYGVLPKALSPFGDGRFSSLFLSYCKVEELRAKVEKDRPALVVLTWDDLGKLPQTEWLQDHVNHGGNLAVFPSLQAVGGGAAAPAWLGASIGQRQILAEDMPIQPIDRSAPFWSGLRDAEGKLRLGQALARQYCRLTLPKGKEYAPLLGLGLDKVVLAAGRLGKGQVVLSGLAFDLKWSSLPRLKSVVVLAQTIALGGRSQDTSGLSIVAGTAPDALPGKDDKVHIVSLVGDPLDWSGPRSQVPVFPRTGAYSVRIGDESFCLSVRSSDREGTTKLVESDVVPALGRLPHTVRALSTADLQEALAGSRTGLPLYLPLLILAMLGLVAESLLGAPPQRSQTEEDKPRKPGTGKSPPSRKAPARKAGKGVKK